MPGLSDTLTTGLIGGLGTGNVYFVIKRAETHFDNFYRDYQTTYSDGTDAVHIVETGAYANVAIQAALDSCAASRNDYVILMPSATDYDIYAALTMSDKAVHLIGAGGIMDGVAGSTNAVRIHQNTAATACITCSAAAVEIAGIFFKVYAALQAITLTSGSAYCLDIHHNSFPWNTTGGTNAASIVGTGDAGAWSMIHHNYFFSYSGGGSTQAVAAVDIAASATLARVCYNDATAGEVLTIGTIFNNLAVKGHTDCNNISVTSDVTITHAITIGATGCAIGNLVAAPTTYVAGGGTVDRSFVNNYAGLNGGTVQDNDT